MSTASPKRTKAYHQKHRRDKSLLALYHRYKAIVITGMEFNKFKYGRVKRRVVWCDPVLTTIYWGNGKDVRLPTGRYNVAKAKGRIPISSITSLIVDKRINASQCPLFQQKLQQSPDNCLSIITAERTIDLEADSTAARDSFATAIGNIVFGDRSLFDLGEEDDDFNDEVDDAKALFESDTSESNHAVEEYSKVYHQRKLSRDIQSEITIKAQRAHNRSHSYITNALMDKDSRFRRLASFVQSTREQFQADRGAFYLVDLKKGLVESVVIEGQQGDATSFQLNQSLVGTAAATGEIMIVPDAYADPRFDQANDIETSYKTTSVLLAPIHDRAGRVAAVLEFRNKQDHQYSKDYFTIQHAAALQNKCNEMKGILNLIQDHDFQRTLIRVQNPIVFVSEHPRSGSDAGDSSNAESSASSSRSSSASPTWQAQPKRRITLLYPKMNQLTIDALQEAKENLKADRVALYIVDRENHSVKSAFREGGQESDSITFKFEEGLIGTCASEGAAIVVDDAYDDARFDKTQDKIDSYKTTSVLCVPVKNIAGETVAVVQFINKQDMPFRKAYFRAADCENISLLLRQIAAGIAGYHQTTPDANIFKIDESDETEIEPGVKDVPE